MTPPIRTRPDGTKYPITGKGGGKARTVVAAGAAATLIAAGPSLGGFGVVGGTGASVTGGFSSITSSVMRAKVVKAKKVMRSGKPARAWRQLGLRKGKPRRIARASCVRNSYGQVQTWLRFHPCRSLKRLALPLTDGRGNTVLLTVAWVKMRNANDARNFKRLIDVHGTGDIKPVAMECGNASSAWSSPGSTTSRGGAARRSSWPNPSHCVAVHRAICCGRRQASAHISGGRAETRRWPFELTSGRERPNGEPASTGAAACELTRSLRHVARTAAMSGASGRRRCSATTHGPHTGYASRRGAAGKECR